MSAKDNGGQAFPAGFATGPMGDLYHPTEGMTLRDWCAGQALVGIISGYLAGGAEIRSSEVARLAYGCANAMIAERAK